MSTDPRTTRPEDEEFHVDATNALPLFVRAVSGHSISYIELDRLHDVVNISHIAEENPVYSRVFCPLEGRQEMAEAVSFGIMPGLLKADAMENHGA